MSSWGLCRATYTICRGAISVRYSPPIRTLMSSYCRSPPIPRGYVPLSLYMPYIPRTVEYWGGYHCGNASMVTVNVRRTSSIYHGNRVQYPHCCSITMVIRMQYSLVLRTYVRTAQCRARKKNYTTRSTYVRTWVLEYYYGYVRVLVPAKNDATSVYYLISTHRGTLFAYCRLKIHNFFQVRSYWQQHSFLESSWQYTGDGNKNF